MFQMNKSKVLLYLKMYINVNGQNVVLLVTTNKSIVTFYYTVHIAIFNNITMAVNIAVT